VPPILVELGADLVKESALLDGLLHVGTPDLAMLVEAALVR